MSLVHKIPPLVSAIAFGYGVGMAAPDSTIAPMKDAVLSHERIDGPALLAATSKNDASPLLEHGVTKPLSGEESTELGRLRAAQVREAHRGEACDLDRPTYSRQRVMTPRDRFADEVDDLDTAGTEALSRLQLPDLKVAITRRTLKYVKFFTRTDHG